MKVIQNPEKNIREYEAVRNEIITLKKCVTDYMGFIFSGSGLALVGLSLVTSLDVKPETFIYAPLSISIILLYVLLIIFYKFTSHNLQAGYCKLLNKEVWQLQNSDPEEQIPEIVAWEWCVELLRSCALQPYLLNELLDDLPMDITTTSGKNKAKIKEFVLDRSYTFATSGSGGIKIAYEGDEYRRLEPKCNEGKRGEGFKFLMEVIFSTRVRSDSWKFPAWVTTVFFLLDLMFYSIGLYSCIPLLLSGFNLSVIVPLATLLLVTAIHILLWRYLFGKLYCLMLGDDTVDASYWRFIPIRNYVLKHHNIQLKRV